jgi:hypothetical protein
MPATEDLRIEPDEFESIAVDEIEQLSENYTSRRMVRFLNGIRKDLRR